MARKGGELFLAVLVSACFASCYGTLFDLEKNVPTEVSLHRHKQELSNFINREFGDYSSSDAGFPNN